MFNFIFISKNELYAKIIKLSKTTYVTLLAFFFWGNNYITIKINSRILTIIMKHN